MRISDWSSDVCSSDLPSSLLYGALMLHERHGMTLPGAIATVTGNPADMIGLDDRGRIRPGARADLIRVRSLGDGVPVVRRVWREGAQVMVWPSPEGPTRNCPPRGQSGREAGRER